MLGEVKIDGPGVEKDVGVRKPGELLGKGRLPLIHGWRRLDTLLVIVQPVGTSPSSWISILNPERHRSDGEVWSSVDTGIPIQSDLWQKVQPSVVINRQSRRY